MKSKITNEKKVYYRRKLTDNNLDSRSTWKLVYSFLGLKENKAPTRLKKDDQVISNPKEIAKEFIDIFHQKVKQLRDQTDKQPTIDPITRPQNWYPAI